MLSRTVLHVTGRALVCAAIGTLPLAACAAQAPVTSANPQHHHAVSQVPAAGVALPVAGMDQLATTLGCPNPNMQVDAAELRQALCQTPEGRYVLLTFSTDAGKRAWLDEAQPYGGTYLVGDRWAVVSERPLLERLQGRLGGQIEGSGHGGH
jgi:hypothetical protein